MAAGAMAADATGAPAAPAADAAAAQRARHDWLWVMAPVGLGTAVFRVLMAVCMHHNPMNNEQPYMDFC